MPYLRQEEKLRGALNGGLYYLLSKYSDNKGSGSDMHAHIPVYWLILLLIDTTSIADLRTHLLYYSTFYYIDDFQTPLPGILGLLYKVNEEIETSFSSTRREPRSLVIPRVFSLSPISPV